MPDNNNKEKEGLKEKFVSMTKQCSPCMLFLLVLAIATSYIHPTRNTYGQENSPLCSVLTSAIFCLCVVWSLMEAKVKYQQKLEATQDKQAALILGAIVGGCEGCACGFCLGWGMGCIWEWCMAPFAFGFGVAAIGGVILGVIGALRGGASKC